MLGLLKPRRCAGVSGTTTFYRPNEQFRNVSMRDVARMAEVFARHPYERRAIADPDGAFISPVQHGALPADLKGMFSPTDVTIHFA